MLRVGDKHGARDATGVFFFVIRYCLVDFAYGHHRHHEGQPLGLETHPVPCKSFILFIYTLSTYMLVSATTITITTTITLRNIGDDDGHTRKSDFNYIYIRGQTTVHRRLGPTLWTVLVVPD